MAIYSCHHSNIGLSTQKQPHTAAAHINYITRTSATTKLLAEHMPIDRHDAVRWMKRQELDERKNARMIDKLMIALPLELTHEQNVALVRDFAQQLTSGRCPWFAAIHAGEIDAKNPHVHLVFRDRDIETGKRVMNTTEKGSTDRFRMVWEQTCNSHLALHGHNVRIDRRTLEAQGIDRQPQIHIGPEANSAAGQGHALTSHTRPDKLKIGQKKPRDIRYPDIDGGRTRRDFNENIIDLNLERLKRSGEYGAKQIAGFEIERRKRIRELLKRRDDIRHTCQNQRGRIWDEYTRHLKKIIKPHHQEMDRDLATLKESYRPVWRDHFQRKEQAFRDFQLFEKNFIKNIARDVSYYWNQLDTTQDKTRGRLSKLFSRKSSLEDKEKALKDLFEADRRRIFKEYNKHKDAIREKYHKKYDPSYKAAGDDWNEKKDRLSDETDKLWQDYAEESKAVRRDIEAERRNLESFLKDYESRAGEKAAGQDHHPPPSPAVSPYTSRRDDILKKLREKGKKQGGHGRDDPDHER